MAVNIKLESNVSTSNWKELYPLTNFNCIKGDNIYGFEYCNVEVPVSSEVTQTIPLTCDNLVNKKQGVYTMILLDKDSDSKTSFETIDQYEVKNGSLVITRLGAVPTKTINIQLQFIVKGAE